MMLSLASLLLAPRSLYSYTLRGAQNIGDETSGMEARSASLGSVGISLPENALGLFSNPANIPFEEGGTGGFTVTPEWTNSFERRQHQDKNLSTFLNTKNSFPLSSGALFIHPRGSRISVSAGSARLYDANYLYSESLGAFGIVTSKNGVASRGWIYGAGGGAAFSLSEKFVLGFSAYSLYGKTSLRFQDTDLSVAGVVTAVLETSIGNRYSGFAARIGARYSLSSWLSASLVYSPSTDLSVTVTSQTQSLAGQVAATNVEQRISLPNFVGGGLTLKAKGAVETTLFLEGGMSYWKRSEVEIVSGATAEKKKLGYRDALEWHGGVEHRLKGGKGLPFRYGIFLLPDYSKKGVNWFGITVGSGFRAAKLIDVSFAFQHWARRETEQARTFPVAKDPGFPLTNKDITDNTLKRFMITTTVRF